MKNNQNQPTPTPDGIVAEVQKIIENNLPVDEHKWEYHPIFLRTVKAALIMVGREIEAFGIEARLDYISCNN